MLLLFPLIEDAAAARPAFRLLSKAERQRAERFRSEAAGRRFAVGRAVLRLVLAAFCRTEAAALRMGAGSEGKPFCEDRASPCFNLAHTGTPDGGFHALLALAEEPVGVDLEGERPLADIGHMADLVLAPAELAHLADGPDAGRATTFLRYWTVKEAVLKALGLGLTVSPRLLDVGPLDPAPLVTRPVALPPSLTDGGPLHVDEVRPGNGLLGAVASARPWAAALRALSSDEVATWLSAGRVSLEFV